VDTYSPIILNLGTWLLGIELHHKLFTDWKHLILSTRKGPNGGPDLLGLDLQPGGKPPLLSPLDRLLNGQELLALFPELHHIPLLDEIGRDSHFSLVDQDMAVPDQLAGLIPRIGEARPVDHIVEPPLELFQQDLSRHPLSAVGLLEVAAKLTFQHPVKAAHLLLFP
jgi:hypothetical protein